MVNSLKKDVNLRMMFKCALLFLILVGFVGNSAITTSYDLPIDVLAIVDDEYGANAPEIISTFRSFGWNVTIAGLKETVISCNFYGNTPLNTNVLISNIGDITVYDCVSVLPGLSHVNLLSSQIALDLIKDAADANLVVSGWCTGVRVLAYADVIDGKNVTGDTAFIADYEAAGATYVGFVLPVIDGNIVTGVKSNAWQGHMCCAIGKAIGIFEDDLPVMGEVTVEFLYPTHPDIVTISVELSDASGIQTPKIRIYELNETTGERLSDYPAYKEDLIQNQPGIYGVEILMDIGLYTVDIKIIDNYYNELAIEDLVQIEISSETTEESSWSVISLFLVCILIPMVAYVRKMKQN